MAGLIETIPRRRVQLADGSWVLWDDFHHPDPRATQDNQSRNGFKNNCYTNGMGRFLQETIKWGLERFILRIHDKDIPRYDKQAYVFEDPRLDHIVKFLKGSMAKHFTDNDTERKHAILGAFIDMSGFFMKEDIFYRARAIKGLADLAEDYLAHPEMYTLTPEELYNYEMFKDAQGISCHQAGQRIGKFEDWKKQKGLA